MILTEFQKQLLLAEQACNISMLCLAEEYPLLQIMEQERMLMCRFMSDEEWCHFSYNSTPEFIQSFFSKNKRGQYIVISDDDVCQWVQQHYRTAWTICCNRLFLDDAIPLSDSSIPQPIRLEHLSIVYATSKYQQFLSMDYLAKRLELGGGFFVEQDRQPVAWVMTHDDGSVGMVHVLDKYRGRGYARLLIQAMAQKVRQKGRPVFAHIEPVNFPSLTLFRSLGFEVHCKVTWGKTV